MNANSGPGYKKYPDHRITTKPAGVRVQVKLDGEVIADTRDAIRLEEGDYPAVYYFPRKDVKMERLVPPQHQNRFPLQGAAAEYFPPNGGGNGGRAKEGPSRP